MVDYYCCLLTGPADELDSTRAGFAFYWTVQDAAAGIALQDAVESARGAL